MKDTYNSPVTITLAENDDFDIIFSIWCHGNDFLSQLPSLEFDEVRKSFLANFSLRNGIFNYWKLTTESHEILGWGSIIRGSNTPFRSTVVGETSVYISKNYFGLGYGIALLNFIVHKAKESELQLLTAFISVANETSLKLARRAGFMEVGVLPSYDTFAFVNSKAFLACPLKLLT